MPATLDGLGHYRNDILLMGTGSQLGDNPAIGLMNGLTGYYVGQHHAVTDHRRGSVIARRLDS